MLLRCLPCKHDYEGLRCVLTCNVHAFLVPDFSGDDYTRRSLDRTSSNNVINELGRRRFIITVTGCGSACGFRWRP
jgi:hypothetical protein